MKTTLKAITALATILALHAEAAGQANFAPIKPIVQPQIVRPVTVPRTNVHRLTKRAREKRVEPPAAHDDDHVAREMPRKDLTKRAARPNLSEPADLPPVPRRQANRTASGVVGFAPMPKARAGGPAIAEGSPQPKSPIRPAPPGGAAIHADGPRGIAGLGRHAGHLAHWRDIARLGDLETFRAGNNAVDNDTLGAGRRRPNDPGATLRGPQHENNDPSDQAWRPEPPRQTASGPGNDDDGFGRPSRNQRKAATVRGGADWPGRAGDGVRGQNDRTRLDGGSSVGRALDCETDCDVFDEEGGGARTTHSENGETTVTEYDSAGNVTAVHDFDSEGRIRGTMRYDSNGNIVFDSTHYYTPDGTRVTHRNNWRSGTSTRRWYPPNDQPNPDPNALGDGPSCGSGRWDFWLGCVGGDLSSEDLVSQPAPGVEEEDTLHAQPSVAKRRNAVTQPVPPEGGGARTGAGGGGSRPTDPCIRAKCGPALPH